MSVSPASSPKRNLSSEEIEQATKLFRKIDTNSSGTIDLLELSALFKQMDRELTEADAEEVLTKVDTDCDGVISFTEFLRAVAFQKSMDDDSPAKDEENMVLAFEQCGGNRDKTGEADPSKVASVFEAFGLEVNVGDMFGESKGGIDFDVFSQFFRHA